VRGRGPRVFVSTLEGMGVLTSRARNVVVLAPRSDPSSSQSSPLPTSPACHSARVYVRGVTDMGPGECSLTPSQWRGQTGAKSVNNSLRETPSLPAHSSTRRFGPGDQLQAGWRQKAAAGCVVSGLRFADC
jgi:hypothetical protein